MTDKKTLEWYQYSFELLEKSLNGESASPLHATRRSALETFAGIGFPTNRDEEWRFTNVAPIAAANFAPVLRYDREGVTGKQVDRFSFGGLKCTRLVFINGQFSGEFSSKEVQKGVTIESLKTAAVDKADLVNTHLARYVKAGENAFTALNTAFFRDGAFIHVADTVNVINPVHLIFVAAGEKRVAITPRNLIVVGKGSRVSIVESYVSVSPASYLTNAVTEFVVGENAVIEHDKLQDESMKGYHVGTLHFQQHANSTIVSNAINLGASLARNNITAVMDGEGVESTLNGLSLSTGTQLIDNHTTIDHARPNCASHELYKAILDGKSRGVFNGKIFVRKDAQKTDAKQTNRTLLLSDEATMDTKPQLEIFADDVKCTHGATVGHLDKEQKFYLRSRGIGEVEANDLLTFAFASDVVNRVHIDDLRERLDRMIGERLHLGRQLDG